MKEIEWFWNLVHYKVFIWRNRVSNFLLAPFFKLLRTSTVRNLYSKKGVSDPDMIVRDAILNPINSSNAVRSGGTMGVLLLLICLAVFQVYTGLFGTELNTNPLQLLVYLAIIVTVNHFLLYKENKYLKYFEEFNGWSNERKRKYGWISFMFIIVIVIFLIAGFKFEVYMLNQRGQHI